MTYVIENESGISSGMMMYCDPHTEHVPPEIGDIATIQPTDENGMPSEDQTGKIIEIIE
jgi:hypothetical protein